MEIPYITPALSFNLALDQWFSNGVISRPPGDIRNKYLQMLGEGVTNIWWVEASDAAIHPAMDKTAPTTKNYPAPEDNSAKVKKPGFRWRTEIQLKLQNKYYITVQQQGSEEDLVTNSEKQRAVQLLHTEFHTHLLNNTIHYPDPMNGGAKYNPDVKENKEKWKSLLDRRYFKDFQDKPTEKSPIKRLSKKTVSQPLILNRP